MPTVAKNRYGPVWPLGNIVVPTPGTPVGLMSLVDPTSAAAPETATTPGVNPSSAKPEYTFVANQVEVQGMKAGAGPPKLTPNTGNVYLVLRGATSDTGTIILTVQPGETQVLAASALNRNVFSPYELYLDADNANDGAQVTIYPQ